MQLWHAVTSEQQAGKLEATCRRWLTREECERAARFRQATSQNQFVVGRGMTRHLLGERLGVDPRTVCFEFSSYGKPHLVASPTIEFNVAHTSGLVVVAIGSSGSVGVDVEAIDRSVDLQLAQRYFADSEVNWLAKQPRASQTSAFMRIWTLKESFIKAIGTGLSMPLDQFAFQEIESEHPTLTFTDDGLPAAQQWGPAQAWQSYVFNPHPQYIAAVTVNGSQRPSVTSLPYGV